MIFKRLIFTLAGIGGISGLVAGVVSCGKTANAILPVEYVITSENFSARSDRSDTRTAPGLSSWTTGVAGKPTTIQIAFKNKIAPGIAATLKTVLSGFVGNYDEIDKNWEPLFKDMNSERSGSGSTMVEMSRLYFRNSGDIKFAPGKTVVSPKEEASVQFVIEKIHFDGYATTGNSPNEAFNGLMAPDKGHHWEIDLTNDPIVLDVKFVNNTDKDISSLEAVNYDTWSYYVVRASSQTLTPEQYRAILASGPSASNYYKSRVSRSDFLKIFGPNAVPVKVTTVSGT